MLLDFEKRFTFDDSSLIDDFSMKIASITSVSIDVKGVHFTDRGQSWQQAPTTSIKEFSYAHTMFSVF